MTSNMESAFSPNSTTPSHLILDALPGIGITKSALAAQRIGPSMETRNAFQFLINARLTEMMVLVFHASRDTTLKKEPAFSHHSTTLSLLILDVPPGIGIIKSALLAPNNGFSMLIRFAFQFLTNAPPTVITEPVFHASRVTILRKEPVFSLHSTMPSLLILDVPPGTGITKSASAAQSTGFSMETRNVFQFLTNALLMLITETASHASRDTILRTEPVSSHPSTTPILPTLGVPPGTGTTKSASAAPRDGSSTQRRDACPLTTTATATTTVVPAPHASLGTL